MKKFYAFMLATIMLVSFVFPASAFSTTDENELNGTVLSFRRFSAKILGKSESEFADDILRELRVSEDIIAKIPFEKKMEIAAAKSIRKIEEYGKINGDGEEIKLSESEYNEECDLLEKAQSNENEIQPFAQGDVVYAEDDGKDKLFAREMLIVETENAPKGTFGVILYYRFKNMPLWRGEDVISISAEAMTLDRSSFEAFVQYQYSFNNNSGLIEDAVLESYTPDTIKDANDLLGFTNAIAFCYNLPDDTFGGGMHYYNLEYLVMVSMCTYDSRSQHKFNVYGNYFHQKVGAGSFGVKVTAEGASVSVSPKVCYEMHQIMTLAPIIYNP